MIVTEDTLLEQMRKLNQVCSRTYNLDFTELEVTTPSYTGPRLQVALIHKNNGAKDGITGFMDYNKMQTILDLLYTFASTEAALN